MKPAHENILNKAKADASAENNGIFEFITSRRSIRAYKDEPIPADIINRMIESAVYAPIAARSERPKFIVVTNPSTLERVIKLTADFYENMVKLSDSTDFLNRLKTEMPEQYLMLKNEELIKKSASLSQNLKNGKDTLFYSAPCLIIAAASKNSILPRENCCYALYNIILAGHSLGIGSCINGLIINPVNQSTEIKQMLKISDGYSAHAAAVFGYPECRSSEIPKREKAEVTWI